MAKKLDMAHPIIDRARSFAYGAHAAIGQRRKYTNEPYFHHCNNVANLVASCDDATASMVAAAFLHDTVEDTQVTEEMIFLEFGSKVHQLVDWMTEKPNTGENRKVRKQKQVERWAKAPPDAKTIKLADLIDNTSSIVLHDKGFARVYIPEKRALLPSLLGGSGRLMAIAIDAIARAEGELASELIGAG